MASGGEEGVGAGEAGSGQRPVAGEGGRCQVKESLELRFGEAEEAQVLQRRQGAEDADPDHGVVAGGSGQDGAGGDVGIAASRGVECGGAPAEDEPLRVGVVDGHARGLGKGKAGAGLGREGEQDVGVDRALQEADLPGGRAGEIRAGAGDQRKDQRGHEVEGRDSQECGKETAKVAHGGPWVALLQAGTR